MKKRIFGLLMATCMFQCVMAQPNSSEQRPSLVTEGKQWADERDVALPATVSIPVTEILSYKSTMIRWAVFSPMPLTLFSSLSLPELMTLQSSAGLRAESIMRAVLPPMPDTVINNRNNSLSCLVEKPKSTCASSRIASWM